MIVTRGWGMDGELMCKRYRILVWADEKILEVK
jgi:hypothetical protein